MELAEAVHRYPIVQPKAAHESLVEADRQRMIKDSLLEHIIATCVETVSAGRLIVAATSPIDKCTGDVKEECEVDDGATVDVLRGMLTGDNAAITEHWPIFTKWLAFPQLLYVPLGKGGRPPGDVCRPDTAP